jgi:hypothetical protein
MPIERFTPAHSGGPADVRDAAWERARARAAAASRLVHRHASAFTQRVLAAREARRSEPATRRDVPLRKHLPPVEAWLAVGCIVVTMWAVGWL